MASPNKATHDGWKHTSTHNSYTTTVRTSMTFTTQPNMAGTPFTLGWKRWWLNLAFKESQFRIWDTILPFWHTMNFEITIYIKIFTLVEYAFQINFCRHIAAWNRSRDPGKTMEYPKNIDLEWPARYAKMKGVLYHWSPLEQPGTNPWTGAQCFHTYCPLCEYHTLWGLWYSLP